MLTLVQTSSTSFYWTLSDSDDGTPLATPEFELGFELNALVRGFLSDPRPDNGKRLSGALGKTIMGTPVCQRLNSHLAYASDCVVYLAIPDSVAHMPWEMMRLSVEGTSLALAYQRVGWQQTLTVPQSSSISAFSLAPGTMGSFVIELYIRPPAGCLVIQNSKCLNSNQPRCHRLRGMHVQATCWSILKV